jgi:hypothetical protein
MITANQVIVALGVVSEEYEMSVKTPRLYVEVLSYPDNNMKSIVDGGNNARFVASLPNKKVYFWNASYTHDEMRKAMGRKNKPDDDPSLVKIWSDLWISGLAILTGNKFKLDVAYEPEAYGLPEFIHSDAKRFFSSDWSWAYPAITGLKEEFEKYKVMFEKKMK